MLITRLTRDKESLQESMVELQTDIQQLERTLGEAREEQQLLLQYPDLNGPVNTDLQGRHIRLVVFSFTSPTLHVVYVAFTHHLSRLFLLPRSNTA